MKKQIGIFILIVIIIICGYVGYQIYKEANIKNSKAQVNDMQQETLEQIGKESTQEEQNEKQENLKLIPQTYQGYKVAAKLKIEKLNIDTYVLEEYSKQAMEVATAKYFGPEPNETGNYCIAGHNYIRKNMFSELGNLKEGDKFTLTDNWHGVVEYEIYDKYKASPTETQALSQRTDGKTEVTLITCTNYTDQRIIIKAKRVV